MIFTLEGNIGAGKSCLLARLGGALAAAGIPHVLLPEPVDEWTSTRVDDGRSLLELFYSDKARHGFMFQMFVLQTRIRNMLDCLARHPGAVVITERCHVTDCELFARMLEASGVLSQAEMLVYRAWYDMCSGVLDQHLRGIVYLRASPATCVERILQRDRRGENSMSLDYIRDVHDAHERWILSGAHQVAVAVVDGDVPQERLDIDGVVAFIRERVATFAPPGTRPDFPPRQSQE